MSQGGPALPGGPYNSTSALELTFDTTGTFTLNADWTPSGGGTSVSSSLTVNVVSADFGDSFIVQTYNRRTWSIAGVSGVLVEADSGNINKQDPASKISAHNIKSDGQVGNGESKLNIMVPLAIVLVSILIYCVSIPRKTAKA